MQVRGASLLRNSGSGNTRIVALVCCLISASQDGLPQNPPYANPPPPFMNSMNCAFVAPGTTATSTGASLGGPTRPLSSECVMISPPISRVETPQEVFHTYSRPPAAV